MNDLVKIAISKAETLKKKPGSIPWRPDEAWVQPFYAWNAGREEWESLTLTAGHADAGCDPSIDSLALYSWNIDFMLPFPEARMQAALDHLAERLAETSSSTTTATVIFFQECTLSDLGTLSQQQWIRDHFYMTDIDTSAWASGAYGTTTLIDRRLEVTSCFRVHYAKTAMERDALFVDVVAPAASTTTNGRGKTIRLGNSHLESLVAQPPLRPSQVEVAARFMKEDGIADAVFAGDFNAIQPFDSTLHTENGLKDAYLEQGGQEYVDEGFTWGQQALRELRETFGCSRMDKIFFRGGFLNLLSFERFGADVEIQESRQEMRDELLALGFEKPWITDHLGVRAVFSFTKDS